MVWMFLGVHNSFSMSRLCDLVGDGIGIFLGVFQDGSKSVYTCMSGDND